MSYSPEVDWVIRDIAEFLNEHFGPREKCRFMTLPDGECRSVTWLPTWRVTERRKVFDGEGKPA